MSVCERGAAAHELLEALPQIPRDEAGPVFAEPWQAQAFAMTIALYERGLFTWAEWAASLSRAIKSAQLAGDRDVGDTYYQHWLTALEALIVEKGVSSTGALQDRAEAWDRAARATPHGSPIDLGNDPLQNHR